VGYPFQIDFKNPDYIPVMQHRMDRLASLRANPSILPHLKTYYRANPIDFIEDWGVTFDPRNPEVGRPSLMPFLLFPKQKEWLQWLLDCWRNRENGLSDKSRDMGLTWLAASLFCTLAIHEVGFVAGFGSRKEDLVDKAGDPDSIFFKVRMFMDHLPPEFNGGWNPNNYDHSSHMRIMIPATGSIVRGEAGKNIGRGGRASIYLVDEAAHLEQAGSIETSLSFTTNCRIDISSVNGTSNPFAEKRFSGRVNVLTMHWRDDPRKGEDWYAAQCAKFNPLVIAQEVDIDYAASAEGVLIPSEWVQAAIDAHIHFKIPLKGDRTAALDVADEGIDLNAFSSRIGVVLQHVEGWTGKLSNIYKTTLRAFALCDDLEIDNLNFDSDGLGVGVRGDAEAINESEGRRNLVKIEAIPFRGSGEVIEPDKKVMKNLTNADVYANRKAQAWWHLRTLFENTYKARQGILVSMDEIICIPSTIPERVKLVAELSQPTYSINSAGKILVDKAPEINGVKSKSPNYADSIMILYAPKKTRKSFFG
jgi:phage terminase large subunit